MLAQDWNKTALNPTWHGEIDAVDRLASAGLGSESKHLVLYTTAEPCPMCQAAVLWSGIEEVVFGTAIPTLQRLRWRQLDITAEEVVRRSPAWNGSVLGGILERECDALFETAIARRR